MMGYHPLCRIDDLIERQGQFFLVDGQPICLVRIGDQVYALDDRCPHAGASLSRGYVEGDVVRCRIHHWGFRLSDGACVDGPNACYGARTMPVRIVDGQVEVLVEH